MTNLQLALIAAIAVTATIAVTQPAAAVEYPWCAQYGSDNDGTNCGFTTLDQCRAAISGNGGFCIRNPFHPDWDQSKRSRMK